MESALKLSAFAQRQFGVGDAIKSWYGLFNLFLEAYEIVIAENLHASAFSEIAKSRTLLRRQLQVITSSRSSIFSNGRELHSLPFESVDIACARRVDPLEIIQSHMLATQQERRLAYRCKCRACLKPP